MLKTRVIFLFLLLGFSNRDLLEGTSFWELPLLPPPNYGYSFSIEPLTLEEIRNFLGSGDTPEALRRSYSVVAQNPALLEELLLHSDLKFSNSEYRHDGLNRLVFAYERGIVSLDRFLEINFKLSQLCFNNFKQTSPESADSILDSIKNTLANFTGNQGTSSTELQTILSKFEYSMELLKKMELYQKISNPGILKSIFSKLKNASNIFTQKKPNYIQATVHLISAILNEISAQKGKHITNDGAEFLIQFFEKFINQLNNYNP